MRVILILLLFNLCVAHCDSQSVKPASVRGSKPFVLGVIDEINSKELAEKRILNIYLPEGYEKDDTTKYPVIYLLDGSADEDFIHVVGLVQFNNFSWINRVPKSIVVGIANIDRSNRWAAYWQLRYCLKNQPCLINILLSVPAFGGTMALY